MNVQSSNNGLVNKGLLTFLETLIAATLDESEWRHFLAELCGATSSINASMIRSDSTKGRQVLGADGYRVLPHCAPGSLLMEQAIFGSRYMLVAWTAQ